MYLCEEVTIQNVIFELVKIRNTYIQLYATLHSKTGVFENLKWIIIVLETSINSPRIRVLAGFAMEYCLMFSWSVFIGHLKPVIKRPYLSKNNHSRDVDLVQQEQARDCNFPQKRFKDSLQLGQMSILYLHFQ